MRRFVFVLAVATCIPVPALAADILLVCDSTNDENIADALRVDGHTVTVLSGHFAGGTNPDLMGDLTAYDAVFWSQDGPGYGEAVTDAALFTNLTDYVSAGGRVFVTGYDSVASPTDPMLIAFLGATGSGDVAGPAGTIVSMENSLTVGVVDIQGVTPSGGDGDTDQLTGLGPDTVGVAPSGSGGWEWTLRTLGAGEIAYIANGNSVAWDVTAMGGPGAFNAAIRNFAATADRASIAPGAPEIEFGDTLGLREGDAVTVTVTVTDLEGDAFTFSWDTDDDGVFGELPGMDTFTIPAGMTDGPMALPLSVQASDGTNVSTRTRTVRIGNVAPVITSMPPVVVSVFQALRYEVLVDDPGGDLDPPTVTLVSGPASASISGTALLWTPNDGDVTMGDERVHFEIAVDDGDGGVVNQAWEMEVSPNRLPSNLHLLYPVGGVLIADPTPRLVVEDGVDPDPGDTLTYWMELATDDTFAEPLVRAEMLPEAPGFTFHQLTEDLPPGEYHWRAWASDGLTESADRVATTFRIAEQPVDAPAEDAGPIATPDTGTTTMPRGDCACGVGRGSPGWALLVLALVGLGLRRR